MTNNFWYLWIDEDLFGFTILNSIENLVLGYLRVYPRPENSN